VETNSASGSNRSCAGRRGCENTTKTVANDARYFGLWPAGWTGRGPAGNERGFFALRFRTAPTPHSTWPRERLGRITVLGPARRSSKELSRAGLATGQRHPRFGGGKAGRSVWRCTDLEVRGAPGIHTWGPDRRRRSTPEAGACGARGSTGWGGGRRFHGIRPRTDHVSDRTHAPPATGYHN